MSTSSRFGTLSTGASSRRAQARILPHGPHLAHSGNSFGLRHSSPWHGVGVFTSYLSEVMQENCIGPDLWCLAALDLVSKTVLQSIATSATRCTCLLIIAIATFVPSEFSTFMSSEWL
eukprot:1675995-Amphidinium_carterae.2